MDIDHLCEADISVKLITPAIIKAGWDSLATTLSPRSRRMRNKVAAMWTRVPR